MTINQHHIVLIGHNFSINCVYLVFYCKQLSLNHHSAMARPFVKWAGGKGKLLSTLNDNLPADFYIQPAVTYFEPFVGGGAMLFHMLDHYPNINRVVINDINPALVNCYRRIQNNHLPLIRELKLLQDAFYSHQTNDERRAFYYELRDEYNRVSSRLTIRAAALFIFFNKTCFNGLYRENSLGKFNVPYGRYLHPTICNEEIILNAHNALQIVEINLGEYTDVIRKINWDEYNFFYFDPPYRQLLGFNNFKQYTLNAFNDPEQEALKLFCDRINEHGGRFLLSNSDSELEPGVSYFDRLYEGVNGNQQCSNFGNSECSIFGIKTTVLLASAVQ